MDGAAATHTHTHTLSWQGDTEPRIVRSAGLNGKSEREGSDGKGRRRERKICGERPQKGKTKKKRGKEDAEGLSVPTKTFSW